ncbi:GNAT family N-acetyltransferase, partial [Helcococcus ovis]
IPEIVDFNVFEKYQKNGIGQKLLTAVIDKAKEFSDKVGIGVGLNSNYGKAQRLYVKNGFIPNGTGIYYEGKVLPVNEKCINNDELALYFIKEIK